MKKKFDKKQKISEKRTKRLPSSDLDILEQLFILKEEIPAKVGPYHEGCGTRASCSKYNIHTIINIAWHAGERNQFWSNLLANFVT